jgi:methionyl-tRNA formyltransferase
MSFLIVQGLRDRVFVPPLQAVGAATIEDDRIDPPGYRRKHATKITPKDRKISLLDWEGDRIYRHYRALGRLWSDVWTTAKTPRRLIFEDITLVEKPDAFWAHNSGNIDKDADVTRPRFIVASTWPGSWHPLLYVEDGDGVIFKTVKTALRVGRITVEGQSKKAASKALRNL